MGELSITLEELAQLAERWAAGHDGQRGALPSRIIDRLREPLARAWLNPEVVDAAEAYTFELHGAKIPPSTRKRPPPTPSRGRCQLLLVTKSKETLSILRPAFVLPVDWRPSKESGDSSLRLPRGLASFAEQVLRDVEVKGLSLHLPKEFEEAGVDLSGLEFGYESAWAALAAGAIIFDTQGPRSDVMATAAWRADADQSEKGLINRVEGVQEKLTAAAEVGGKIVFLPRENVADVEDWKDKNPGIGIGIKICFLSNAVTKPRAAVGELLQSLGIPPSQAAGDPFEDRCKYHEQMANEEADDYYRRELLAEACERLRRSTGDLNVCRLAFIASKSLAVPLLLASLFNPHHVLVLHDGNIDKSKLERLTDAIKAIGRDESAGPRGVQVVLCDKDRLVPDVARHVQDFEASTSGKLLVDLTTGYRAFNLALLESAPPDALKAFIHSPQKKDRPGAGQEELQFFPRRVEAPSPVTD